MKLELGKEGRAGTKVSVGTLAEYWGHRVDLDVALAFTALVI